MANEAAEVDRSVCIQTYTGRWFDLANPRPEDVDPLDIAISLSRKCRFGGHCLKFYSVAQHVVLVTLWMAQSLQSTRDGWARTLLWSILHDGHEPYTGDITRPMKRAMSREGYQNCLPQITERIDWAVRDRFGLGSIAGFMLDVVREFDLKLLATEYRDLMRPGLDWGEIKGVQPAAWTIIPLGPDEAFSLFCEFFRRIQDVQPATHQELLAIALQYGAVRLPVEGGGSQPAAAQQRSDEAPAVGA